MSDKKTAQQKLAMDALGIAAAFVQGRHADSPGSPTYHLSRCESCKEHKDVHVEGKCLFGATVFTPPSEVVAEQRATRYQEAMSATVEGFKDLLSQDGIARQVFSVKAIK